MAVVVTIHDPVSWVSSHHCSLHLYWAFSGCKVGLTAVAAASNAAPDVSGRSSCLKWSAAWRVGVADFCNGPAGRTCVSLMNDKKMTAYRKHLQQKRHRCADLGRRGPQDWDVGPYLLY